MLESVSQCLTSLQKRNIQQAGQHRWIHSCRELAGEGHTHPKIPPHGVERADTEGTELQDVPLLAKLYKVTHFQH